MSAEVSGKTRKNLDLGRRWLPQLRAQEELSPGRKGSPGPRKHTVRRFLPLRRHREESRGEAGASGTGFLGLRRPRLPQLHRHQESSRRRKRFPGPCRPRVGPSLPLPGLSRSQQTTPCPTPLAAGLVDIEEAWSRSLQTKSRPVPSRPCVEGVSRHP